MSTWRPYTTALPTFAAQTAAWGRRGRGSPSAAWIYWPKERLSGWLHDPYFANPIFHRTTRILTADCDGADAQVPSAQSWPHLRLLVLRGILWSFCETIGRNQPQICPNNAWWSWRALVFQGRHVSLLTCIELHCCRAYPWFPKFLCVLFQTWERGPHILGFRLWEGLSRPDRRCVLDASLQQRQAGQTCSARQQRIRGIVERSPRGHQGRTSCCNCKDWAWAVLEATAHRQGPGRCRIRCTRCSRACCGTGWRDSIWWLRVSASWAGPTCRPWPDRLQGAGEPWGGLCGRLGCGWVVVDDWSKCLHKCISKPGSETKIRKNQLEIRTD